MYNVPASRSQPKNTENVSRSETKHVPLTKYDSLTIFYYNYGATLFFWSSFNYIDSAVDAEELAGLIVKFFQVFSVPVEIRCDEQVRSQVYTVSVRGGRKYKGFKQSRSSWSMKNTTENVQ